MADAEAAAIPRISILVPTYIMNQPVLVQYSANHWIPGVVTKHFYNARFACLATEVEFHKVDGTRARAGFLDHDVRPRE
ncbi:hypothetical protein VTO73DRAFT_8387 [Trametes versicolor]